MDAGMLPRVTPSLLLGSPGAHDAHNLNHVVGQQVQSHLSSQHTGPRPPLAINREPGSVSEIAI